MPLHISERDRALLQLFDRTPASTPLILKASESFPGEPFRDERRIRERLQALAEEKLARAWPTAGSGGGIVNYYKLTAEGFRLLRGAETVLPPKAFFGEIVPSRLAHTLTLAEVIVHSLVTAHRHRVQISKFYRENELVLQTGTHEQRPDCMFQFVSGNRAFNILFEIDNSTESVDANSVSSIRNKLLGYQAYQAMVFERWKHAGSGPPRPGFRVVFLTLSVERAYHILALAAELAVNHDRRLCYAGTQDVFLAAADPLRFPLFLDHRGAWQALVDVHPSAPFTKAPVRLPRPAPGTPLVW